MQTAFFIASKIIWGLMKPETLLVLVIALACYFTWRKRMSAARFWSTLSVLLMVGIGVFPVGRWALIPLETAYPASPQLDRVDGILVLGGGERPPAFGQPQVNEGGERYIEAMRLARRFPDATVLYTGGSGALSDAGKVTGVHARSAKLFFTDLGLDPERLKIENASRNTAENASMSFALAAPDPGERWVLVTSAFHMPRSMRTFERAGWTNLTPWPADFRTRGARGLGWNIAGTLSDLNLAAKEYVGLIAYGVTGR
ncbi:YdcF family protein [Tropicimonas isoalkanivorans]|uniref:Uncharacterized SAM-binding protein YcdF, DUF218 family n=1 Tax=Tropicimonas isoalkanivorans TaxID=441112 RepID=A0A1I1EAF1_9RHOB|nr:YdcF family protein [Tropicimonas isoalkanivorans]SFB81933.1 Uncharacterized SAM-binding protein YcdF, DUF218 family [Tropicimonas isoalkanivorans]